MSTEPHQRRAIGVTAPVQRLKKLEDDVARALFTGLSSPASISAYYHMLQGTSPRQVDFDPYRLAALRSRTRSPHALAVHIRSAVADIDADYQCSKLLSKSKARGKTPAELKAVALEKFARAETLCALSNVRLQRARLFLSSGRANILPDMNRGILPLCDYGARERLAWVHIGPQPLLGLQPIIRPLHLSQEMCSVLESASRWIKRILGPLTRRTLERVERKMDFGPGATSSLSRPVTRARKFGVRQLEMTPSLVPYARSIMGTMWIDRVGPAIRAASKVTTVPKDSTTDRTICIEPDLNVFVQKGVGAEIRSRVKVFGLDLDDADINRRKAREGSLTGRLATYDLSMASDTISYEVVRLLFHTSDDWLALLSVCRTPKYRLPGGGKDEHFHKWSSMGNGYTWELESLIFYAVLLGCAENGFAHCMGDLGVFGDDLIFPVEMCTAVTRTLDYLGFSVNLEKSFGVGFFRESCGHDYLCGINIRPVFLRSDPIRNRFEESCYVYANQIVEKALGHRGPGLYRDSRLLPAWSRCFTAVPHSMRYRIPYGFGDSVGFYSDQVETEVSRDTSTGSPGWYIFPTYSPGCAATHNDQEGGLRSALFSGTSVPGFLRTRIPHKGRPNAGNQLTALKADLNAAMGCLDTPPPPFSGVEPIRNGSRGQPSSRAGHAVAWPCLGPWL